MGDQFHFHLLVTAPALVLLASTSSLKGFEKSGVAKTGVLHKFFKEVLTFKIEFIIIIIIINSWEGRRNQQNPKNVMEFVQ